MSVANSAPGSSRESRDERARDSLCELNRRFLDLLAAPEAGLAVESAMTSGIQACLARMPQAQRNAIADCPYALFDLSFDDDVHWRTRLDEATVWRVADAVPAIARASEAEGFVRLALFYAWHIAHAAMPTARVQLGMSEAVVAAFRRITLDRLPALALVEASKLSIRWSGHPAYWDRLTVAAGGGNRVALRRVQLYGLQLAAATRLCAN